MDRTWADRPRHARAAAELITAMRSAIAAWLLFATIAFALLGGLLDSHNALIAIWALLLGTFIGAMTATRRPWTRVELAAILSFAIAASYSLSVLLAPGTGSVNTGTTPPDETFSLKYEAHAKLSARGIEITEEMIYDKEFTEFLETLIRPAPLSSDGPAHIFPDTPVGWTEVGRLNGAPIYRRSRILETFTHTSVFAVDHNSIDLSIGNINVSTDFPGGRHRRFLGEVGLIPDPDSTLSIESPKGAIGRSFPEADKIVDLPGKPHREIATYELGGAPEVIDFDILGSGWRNPASRKVYDAYAWGWLSWLLGAAIIALGAFAFDWLKQFAMRRLDKTAETKDEHSTPDAAKPSAGHRGPVVGSGHSGARFELYADGKQFRWRLKARNGKVIASSRSYATKAGAVDGIEKVRGNVPTAEIVDGNSD
jgi:uncharacterized protein YegP (UPF0339 family)